MEKYILVEWPEAQKFTEDEDSVNIGYDPEKNVWFVPEEMYNKIVKKNE